MKYVTHNDDENIDANGTSLVGEIDVSYKDLCQLFGESTDGDGYKTDAEWSVKFEDGVVATIYNWKDGKNYDHENGLDVENITNWHIGGNNKKSLENMIRVVNKYLIKNFNETVK